METEDLVFFLFLLDDGRIRNRIRTFDLRFRMTILDAQKHRDPTDPDPDPYPQNCLEGTVEVSNLVPYPSAAEV
jgi:hypothetical protein